VRVHAAAVADGGGHEPIGGSFAIGYCVGVGHVAGDTVSDPKCGRVAIRVRQRTPSSRDR
jgi:hypothetical protein